jgi:GNAT superfamily N-acetyltransferase
MDITYKTNAPISVEQALELYRKSTLGERRPIDNPNAFEGMLKNASVTVSAWHGTDLVGISRTLTDFTYVAYLADLAVDSAYQKQGIGKRLISETRTLLEKECMLVLLAAPKANEYYPKIGFESCPTAWIMRGDG